MFLILIICYSVFLKARPLKKNVFYTNEERVEEFIYGSENYPIIEVGSSLSGVFENKQIFDKPCLDLFLPSSNACTGVEIVLNSKKVPEKLFIEINELYKGFDDKLIATIFDEPLHTIKYSFPVLLKKNKIIPNIIDRVKKPYNTVISKERPPAVLFDALMINSRREWSEKLDTVKFKRDMIRLQIDVQALIKKGCKICFYEMPMDSSFIQLPVISYTRNYFDKLCTEKGYHFIKIDTSRNYVTGDGEHLLLDEGDIYLKYFVGEASKIKW